MRRFGWGLLIVIVLIGLTRSGDGAAAQGAPIYTVNVTADTADGACTIAHCSLREAIIAANAYAGTDAPTIQLPAGTYTFTRAGRLENASGTGDLDIAANKSVIVAGAGAASTIIDAGGLDRIFHVLDRARLTISDVTIRGGLITGRENADLGGAIRVELQSVAQVTRSHIRNNQAWAGSALYIQYGEAALTDSTVFDNISDSSSPILLVGSGGPGAQYKISFTRTTVSGNSAPSNSMGAFGSYTLVTAIDSTLIGTYSSYGTFNQTNVLLADATSGQGLGPLQDNGGPTFTHALTATSPHVDTGSGCGPVDQRGIARTDGACDRGAYEAAFPPFVMDVGAVRSDNTVESLAPPVPVVYRPIASLAFAPTILAVTFSEAMQSSGVGSLTEIANYRVTDAGPNQTFDSNLCGSLTGDDQRRTIASISSDAAHRIARLTLNAALNDGLCRVEMCGTLTDLSGLALDGLPRDGIGGEADFELFYVELPQPGPIFTPTTPLDTIDGRCGISHCSLREAIMTANAYPGPTIPTVVIPAGTYTLTRSGYDDQNAVGDFDIRASMTLVGAGADQTILDGAGIDRLIDVYGPSGNADRTVTIVGLTVRNGQPINLSSGGGIQVTGASNADFSLHVTLREVAVRDNTAGDSGGGIVLGGPSTYVTIENSTIVGNRTTGAFNPALYGRGGGVFNWANLTMVNSTISGNQSNRWGGGLLNFGWAMLRHVTITGNQADSDSTHGESGGGLYNGTGPYAPGVLSLENTIVFGNLVRGTFPSDCQGDGTVSTNSIVLIGVITDCPLMTGANVISGVDPLLEPLAANGGPTWTHVVQPGSPAIDAGIPAACTTTDQRGVPRPQGAACDLGASERTTAPFALIPPIVLNVTSVYQALIVDFSERLSDLPGDSAPADVTNPANYRLIATGVDGSFQTTGCAVTVGDDIRIVINAVTVDLTGPRVRLTFNGGVPLAAATYRLIVCDALRDADGNALDGDGNGVAGGDFTRTLYIDGAQTGPIFTVTHTDDDIDGLCGIADCSLREAVIAVNAHPDAFTGTLVIALGEGLYQLGGLPGANEDQAQTGDLDVYARVTMRGIAPDTSGMTTAQSDRVLDLHTGALTLENLTVLGGRPPSGEDGGAIRTATGTLLTLTNVSSTSNRVQSGDGTVIHNAGTAVLTRVHFYNNQAVGGDGGAVFNIGTMTIHDSRITNNRASDGGGIGNMGTLTITDSALFYNQADSFGGGIDNRGINGQLTMTNSTLSGNQAWGGGGLYTIWQAQSRLRYVTITQNSAGNLGGGIATGSSGWVSVANSVIAGNDDYRGDGPDCFNLYGTIQSQGYNLFGVLTSGPVSSNCRISGDTTNDLTDIDAQLGPLTLANGDFFHLPDVVSPLIDAANPTVCETGDQIGTARPQGSRCDIGAIEVNLGSVLVGTLDLPSFAPAPHRSRVMPIHVTIWLDANTSAIFEGTVMTDDEGRFRIRGLPAGDYTLHVKPTLGLAVRLHVPHAGAETLFSVNGVSMGDADGDNVINILDFSMLAATFGRVAGDAGYDARADFNGDETISIIDFSILAMGFGSMGAGTDG